MEHFYWNKIKFYHTHAQHFKVKSTIIVPPQYRVTSCYYSPSNWWFDGSVIDICVELFLSNAAAARLPAQQPKTRSAYAACGRYAVLGSIYYGQFSNIANCGAKTLSHFLKYSPLCFANEKLIRTILRICLRMYFALSSFDL